MEEEEEEVDFTEQKSARMTVLGEQFDEVWPRWVAHRRHFDWKARFSKLAAIDGNVDIFKDLMFLEAEKMGDLYTELALMQFVHKKGDKRGDTESMFGLLPQMAMNSALQIGALSAESFCERVISQANLVVQEDNTCLKSEEVEMLVMLRINAGFISHMLQEHGEEFRDDWMKETGLTASAQ